MKDTYSFTTEGLAHIALSGLTPDVVWSALHSGRRLLRHLTATTAAVFAVSESGRYVVVAVAESAAVDDDWDIIGARAMDGEEIAAFNRFIGRQP